MGQWVLRKDPHANILGFANQEEKSRVYLFKEKSNSHRILWIKLKIQRGQPYSSGGEEAMKGTELSTPPRHRWKMLISKSLLSFKSLQSRCWAVFAPQTRVVFTLLPESSCKVWSNCFTVLETQICLVLPCQLSMWLLISKSLCSHNLTSCRRCHICNPGSKKKYGGS